MTSCSGVCEIEVMNFSELVAVSSSETCHSEMSRLLLVLGFSGRPSHQSFAQMEDFNFGTVMYPLDRCGSSFVCLFVLFVFSVSGC